MVETGEMFGEAEEEASTLSAVTGAYGAGELRFKVRSNCSTCLRSVRPHVCVYMTAKTHMRFEFIIHLPAPVSDRADVLAALRG